MSRALGRDQILAVEDLPRELVEVPEWGGAVWVRGLTGAERADYMQALVEIDDKGKARARVGQGELRLAYLCMCDEGGARLFDSGPDLEALGRKSSQALRRVVEVAERLSGIGADAVERAEGNSEATPSAASTSA